MQDGKGRKINYIRVSLTDRCNLRCVYCMPEGGIDKKEHHEIIRHEDVLKILKASAFLGISKVRFTGGEPLIVKDIDKLIYETSKINGIEDIAITTNGILLNSMAGELKKAGLKRVNISLDSLKEDKFRKITRGGSIHDVFHAIEKCIDLGIKPVKINTVLIKGINDDEINDLIRLTKDYPVHVRFIELMPMGEGLNYYDTGFISSEQVLERAEGACAVKQQYEQHCQPVHAAKFKRNRGIHKPAELQILQQLQQDKAHIDRDNQALPSFGY